MSGDEEDEAANHRAVLEQSLKLKGIVVVVGEGENAVAAPAASREKVTIRRIIIVWIFVFLAQVKHKIPASVIESNYFEGLEKRFWVFHF